jgi:hypothetical protein
MCHELRDIRQDFPVRRLVAAAMRRAEEDQTLRRILDRLVSWLQPCLEQSLEEWSAVDLYHRVLWHRHTCFTTIPPRECAMNMRGR